MKTSAEILEASLVKVSGKTLKNFQSDRKSYGNDSEKKTRWNLGKTGEIKRETSINFQGNSPDKCQEEFRTKLRKNCDRNARRNPDRDSKKNPG